MEANSGSTFFADLGNSLGKGSLSLSLSLSLSVCVCVCVCVSSRV